MFSRSEATFVLFRSSGAVEPSCEAAASAHQRRFEPPQTGISRFQKKFHRQSWQYSRSSSRNVRLREKGIQSLVVWIRSAQPRKYKHFKHPARCGFTEPGVFSCFYIVNKVALVRRAQRGKPSPAVDQNSLPLCFGGLCLAMLLYGRERCKLLIPLSNTYKP